MFSAAGSAFKAPLIRSPVKQEASSNPVPYPCDSQFRPCFLGKINRSDEPKTKGLSEMLVLFLNNKNAVY